MTFNPPYASAEGIDLSWKISNSTEWEVDRLRVEYSSGDQKEEIDLPLFPSYYSLRNLAINEDYYFIFKSLSHPKAESRKIQCESMQSLLNPVRIPPKGKLGRMAKHIRVISFT